MNEEGAASRSDRLAVLLAQFRGVPILDPEEAIESTALLPYGYVCAQAVTADDLALAGAMLSLEAELREKGWAAVERLGALVAAGEGTLQERVLALDGADFVGAASCVVALGWLDG